jgi:3-oxoacyl-[acyl-carrier-protein] synthase II
VITGLGVVSPIGLGRDAFWQSLATGTSGIALLPEFANGYVPSPIGGQIRDFDPKLYVTPRKSLKVMSREIQIGFAAARLALEESGLAAGMIDPERFGVVFGADMIYCDPAELEPPYRSCLAGGKVDTALWGQRALGEMFPLWMLKFLPNMPACHIAIANDARGPNNSVLMGEASSLLALAEAVRLIERSLADVVISGGSGCRVHPMSWVCREEELMSQRYQEPERALRPFDADRDGSVFGEGSAAFVLESRRHAQARGRQPLARVVDYASAFEPPRRGVPVQGTATRAVIRQVLARAGVTPAEIDHVNANGLGTIAADRAEAQAIRDELGDVPVTAPKSFFGNLGAATGAVEMAASVLAFIHGQIPVTLNYERPDPACPVRIVHGQPATSSKPYALLLNQSTTGQSVAVLIARPDEG